MLTAYLPGSILSRGKLYSPLALLTTQVVIVEPAFFAPTITPSIAPSTCEVTVPVSAAADGVSASTKPANALPSKSVPTRIAARCFALPMTTLLLVVRIGLEGRHVTARLLCIHRTAQG